MNYRGLGVAEYIQFNIERTEFQSDFSGTFIGIQTSFCNRYKNSTKKSGDKQFFGILPENIYLSLKTVGKLTTADLVLQKAKTKNMTKSRSLYHFSDSKTDKTIGTRVTQHQYDIIVDAAAKNSMNVSEWVIESMHRNLEIDNDVIDLLSDCVAFMLDNNAAITESEEQKLHNLTSILVSLKR